MTVNKIQLGFMPERETIDAVFKLRRMQEDANHANRKTLYVFCGPKERF